MQDVSTDPPTASEPTPEPPPPSTLPTLPLLPRLLDIVTVVFGLVAITVAATGGFREWTPFGRISMTSWLRPLLWSMIAFAVRSWLWPHPRLFTRISRATGRWMKDDAMAVLPIYLTSRIGVLLIGFLAVALIGYVDPNGPPFRIYQNEFLNLPARYDAGWYIGIALEGYSWRQGSAGQQNIVFFPLLPMLMRYGSLLLARQILWTGVFVSFAAFLWGLVYLYRYAREYVGADRALAGITLLCAYPFAVFYSAPYTESLFLLTSVAACYHFRRDELWKAGAWGLLCGLTRPNGCLLSLVLALMAIGPFWRGGWRPTLAAMGWTRLADRMAVAALPGLGMVAYSIFIYQLTGDPLQWSKQQVGWGRIYYSLDRLVLDQIQRIDTHGLYGYATGWTTDLMYLVAVLFVLISVVPVYRRFGLPLATLIVINVLPPLMVGGLLSMGRTTAVLFPSFMWLGAVVPVSHRNAWVFGFAALQGLCAAMFFTWRPIF
jgi:hypothetical protein